MLSSSGAGGLVTFHFWPSRARSRWGNSWHPGPTSFGDQLNAPLLPCHPDRLTIESASTIFLRMPGGWSRDQPRVMVGLSGWSAFSGVFISFWFTTSTSTSTSTGTNTSAITTSTILPLRRHRGLRAPAVAWLARGLGTTLDRESALCRFSYMCTYLVIYLL